ncbi:hypothetical protein ABIE67_010238 [Streptomyces sp. V4I8]
MPTLDLLTQTARTWRQGGLRGALVVTIWRTVSAVIVESTSAT